MIEIDVSNPKLTYVEELYEVTTVPYLIVVQGDRVLFKGIPTNESYKEVLALLGAPDSEIEQYKNVRDVLMMDVENDVSSFNLKTVDPEEPEEFLEHDAANANHMV